MESLVTEEFRVEARQTQDTLYLDFRGSIQVLNPEDFLDPYLAQAMQVAREEKLKLECDFSHLEYMNSSSIPPLITLMRRMAEERIHGTFRYDASRKVQAASFKALDVIARKSEYTEVTAANA